MSAEFKAKYRISFRVMTENVIRNLFKLDGILRGRSRNHSGMKDCRKADCGFTRGSLMKFPRWFEHTPHSDHRVNYKREKSILLLLSYSGCVCALFAGNRALICKIYKG